MKAVLDANGVVSARLWRGAPFDCLNAWSQGKFQAIIDPSLVAEYEETLEELRLDYPDSPCVDWVTALKSAADLVFPIDRASGVVADPFDEMVLECALAARATFIVSGDKKHLLPLGDFRGIPIISPGDFLRRLR